MRESWKRIENFPNYEVSNMGQIRNAKTMKIRKQTLLPNGYLYVQLNGVNLRVHILVAKAFIPNPDNKEVVNHKHSKRTDNRASQLEWCTQSENIKHSWTVGKRRRACRRNKRHFVHLTEQNACATC